MKQTARGTIRERLGVIGAGNMGTAILEGLLQKRMISPGQVWIFDRVPSKARLFCKRWKTRLAGSQGEVIRRTRTVLLAFKPQDLPSLSAESSLFTGRHIVISILAGTPIKKISKVIGSRAKIVRAMPNLGVKVGAGLTALTGNRSGTVLAGKIFSGCGRTVGLRERDFDTVTAVSGSGPAYFFLLMERLMEEAAGRGIRKKYAEILAVQTALAAALLAVSSGAPPDVLKRMVTSKGGTTEAALRVLEKAGFERTFHEAVRAAVRRAGEMSRGSF
jgi:pyrroline-5-carboxylate reductase